MPNPIAHPAASVPFTKAGLVLSALIVGSISPDFGYFLKLPSDYFMYTIPGLILFDLPAGLVFLLFQALFKWPLLSLPPRSLQRRLLEPAQGFSFGPPKRFLLILLSLLVGSSTHLVSDSFTHSYGWMVMNFGILRTPIGGIALYTILQNLGTLSGMGLLIYWFLRWVPGAPQWDQLLPRFSNRFLVFFLILATVSFVALEGSLIYLRHSTGSRSISGYFLMFSVIFSAILITSLFAGIYSLAWMLKFHKTIPSVHLYSG